MNKTVLALLLGTASCLALAEEASTPKGMETTLVTATRTERSLAEVLAPSTVISRKTIEQLQADDIFDLLEQVPGLVIFPNGGPGSNASLFLRGTNTNQTLVLVDGQRIAGATAGVASISHLSPEQIERIEIIRGPNASLYGADAIGGVINIITRRAEEKNRVLVKAGGGSHESRDSALGMDLSFGEKQKTGSVALSAGANYKSVKGFDSTQDSTGANRDDDEYDNTGIYFDLGYQYREILSAGITHMQNEGDADYDSRCMNSTTYLYEECEPYSHFEMKATSAHVGVQPLTGLEIRATVSQTGDSYEVDDHLIADTSTLFGGDSYFETERTSASLQGSFASNENHEVTLGSDYYQDEVKSLIRTTDPLTFLPIIAPYLDANGKEVNELDNLAFFVQYLGNFRFVKLATSLRRDDHEAYGKNDTGNISLGVPVGANHELILSYGTAFRAPTFNDLYWPDPFGPGNPNLDPEKSKNSEIGFRGSYHLISWQANIFRNRITDLIQWQPIPGDPFGAWAPFNVSDAEIRGLELSTTLSLDSWQVGSSFTHLDTEDKATGKELMRRPENTFRMSVDRNWGNWESGLTLMAYSSRYNDVTNARELGGFTTTELRLAYLPIPSIKVGLKVGNLFDKEYTVASGFAGDYATEGRTGFLTVSYSPSL